MRAVGHDLHLFVIPIFSLVRLAARSVSAVGGRERTPFPSFPIRHTRMGKGNTMLVPLLLSGLNFAGSI